MLFKKSRKFSMSRAGALRSLESSVRYSVGKVEIRSENAAKTSWQASSDLVAWLRRLPKFADGLDYGCGKLRYTKFLANKARSLTLVDSEIQLSRRQKIAGTLTTVRGYARRWHNTRVMSIEDFSKDRHCYDFILCANVLSAFPTAGIRSRVLRRLASALKPQGQ